MFRKQGRQIARQGGPGAALAIVVALIASLEPSIDPDGSTISCLWPVGLAEDALPLDRLLLAQDLVADEISALRLAGAGETVPLRAV